MVRSMTLSIARTVTLMSLRNWSQSNCLIDVVDVLHEIEAAEQTSTERRQWLLTARVRRFDGLAVVEIVHLVDPVDEQDAGFCPVPRSRITMSQRATGSTSL